MLATALLLQTHDKVSDEEAKGRADFDIRWKGALGVAVDDKPFAQEHPATISGTIDTA